MEVFFPDSLLAGLVLAAIRSVVDRSVVEAVGLTILGAVVYAAGLRVARVLGPEEIDLLERADVPGTRAALAWLAPER